PQWATRTRTTSRSFSETGTVMGELISQDAMIQALSSIALRETVSWSILTALAYLARPAIRTMKLAHSLVATGTVMGSPTSRVDTGRELSFSNPRERRGCPEFR